MKKLIKVGNPFEDKSETTLTGRGLMPWEQKVADERTGKRKFHGAFTGGFQAGYKNTCGSNLGFTPQTFVSNRNNRANVTQEITDFMDHEDIEEISINNIKASGKELKADDDSDLSDGGYGPTMPPSQKEVSSKVDYFGLGYRPTKSDLSQTEKTRPLGLFKAPKDLFGEIEYSSTVIEESLTQEPNQNPIPNPRSLSSEVPGFTMDTSILDTTKYLPPVLPANYNPRNFLLSLKTTKKRPEKKDPDPLFSEVLSVQDIDRIKKVKEFVKPKDSSPAIINKSSLPFKDDPIKQARCFNFFCEMEGLETGGLSEAKVMTASQLRNEREEFTSLYNSWKSESKIKAIRDFSQSNLPLKRNGLFEDLNGNDSCDFIVKRKSK